MKKFSIGLPILALLLAVAASAFQTKNDSQETQNVWYTFDSNDYSKVTDRTLYRNTGSSTSPNCGSSGNVCAVLLPDSGQEQPSAGDFSALQQDIQDSQDGHAATDLRIQMFQ